MIIWNRLVAAAFVGFTVVVAHVAAQQPQQPPPPPAGTPQTPPPQGPPPPQPGGRGQGRGGGRPPVFPAQQRPPGDPAVVERGRGLYSVNCSACHGVDLRGGQLGGPNLLRSPVVLKDQAGELIVPVIQQGRPDKGMPPLPLSAQDATAVAEFLHSVLAAAAGQGAPPQSEAPPPDIVVGNATAGSAYFAAKCSACHSATGDLQGIATRIGDPKMLQNIWVSGGRAGGRGRRGEGQPSRAVTVTVSVPGGEKVEGRLLRIDDFIVTLAQPDGTIRSFRRENDDRPTVEIKDPLQPHTDLLAVYTEKDMHDLTAYLVTLK